MRIGNIAIPLLLVGLFCGYLLGSARAPVRPVAPQPAILLSTATEVTPAPRSVEELVVEEGPLDLPLPPPPPASLEAVVASVEAPDATEAADRVDAPAPDAPHRVILALVTAYCPCRRCCGNHANGITSTGTSAWKRGYAADPRAIKYGTKLYIPGYGYTRVDDTGGAMRRVWRRNGMVQIDVRMTYHWQARQWGRKVLKIRVYDED